MVWRLRCASRRWQDFTRWKCPNLQARWVRVPNLAQRALCAQFWLVYQVSCAQLGSVRFAIVESFRAIANRESHYPRGVQFVLGLPCLKRENVTCLWGAWKIKVESTKSECLSLKDLRPNNLSLKNQIKSWVVREIWVWLLKSWVRISLLCLVDLNSDFYCLYSSLHGLLTFWFWGLGQSITWTGW